MCFRKPLRNMAELAPGCSVLLLVSTLSKIDFTLIDDFCATDAKCINSDLWQIIIEILFPFSILKCRINMAERCLRILSPRFYLRFVYSGKFPGFHKGPFWNQASLYTMEMVQCAGVDVVLMVEIWGKSGYRRSSSAPASSRLWWRGDHSLDPCTGHVTVWVWRPCLMMWHGCFSTTCSDLYTWKGRTLQLHASGINLQMFVAYCSPDPVQGCSF